MQVLKSIGHGQNDMIRAMMSNVYKIAIERYFYMFTPVHLHCNSLPYVKMYEDLNSALLRPQMKQLKHIIIKPAVVFARQHHPAFADEHLFKRALLKDSDVIQKDHLLYQSLRWMACAGNFVDLSCFFQCWRASRKDISWQKSQKISKTS